MSISGVACCCDGGNELNACHTSLQVTMIVIMEMIIMVVFIVITRTSLEMMIVIMIIRIPMMGGLINISIGFCNPEYHNKIRKSTF